MSVFGVTPELVRLRYFSQADAFSTVSNPTTASVTEIIAEGGSFLEGRLNRHSLVGSTITDATSSAYLWCRRFIRLYAAIEVATVSTQNPLAKEWQRQLDDLVKELDKDGYLALGDGVTAPSKDPAGPSTHISLYGLDTGSASLASDAVPIFRKDDQQ